jgi:tryptophanyl-tRNA synthetase
MHLVSEKQVIEKFEADFNNCVIRYGDMKKQLAEDMVQFMAPIRDKAFAIQNDHAYLSGIIKAGAEKARASAAATLLEVRKAVGVNYI